MALSIALDLFKEPSLEDGALIRLLFLLEDFNGILFYFFCNNSELLSLEKLLLSISSFFFSFNKLFSEKLFILWSSL
jgi:hypothetical protein